MKNLILYGALAAAFGLISAVCAYNDMAILAAIWSFSCGVWTALTMQAWHFRHD
jgi:hypothetical protein